MSFHRASGILAHITSLPSPHGIGDIGTPARNFIDFLTEAKQTYWQFLPLGPTSAFFDESPYMSNSAFAGSSLLISPELLSQEGLISHQSLAGHQQFSPYQTEFTQVRDYKQTILTEAFQNFRSAHPVEYQNFIDSEPWALDYALFMAAKDVYPEKCWTEWPTGLALKRQESIEAFSEKWQEKISYYLFEQYIFNKQWRELHSYATASNVKLFGDLPVYVALDSVDTWANRAIFNLDSTTLQPTHVSGVPPDYFSETGQKWGNPLYRWQTEDPGVRSSLLEWWTRRFARLFTQVDTVRIDHFRGFESYWAVPADQETAVVGEWLKGPGADFFKSIESALGKLDIIAEDLGIITEDVVTLRKQLGFPGMKVLQFAFDGNLDNYFLPQNFESPECVVYTGTHDNDTTVGWYLSDKIDDGVRGRIKRAANRTLHDETSIHNDFLYLAHSSIARLAIFPLQDILGFGSDCKMNTPGTSSGNWRWRCAPEFLNHDVAQRLADSTLFFGRENRPTKTVEGNSVRTGLENEK